MAIFDGVSLSCYLESTNNQVFKTTFVLSHGSFVVKSCSTTTTEYSRILQVLRECSCLHVAMSGRVGSTYVVEYDVRWENSACGHKPRIVNEVKCV